MKVRELLILLEAANNLGIENVYIEEGIDGRVEYSESSATLKKLEDGDNAVVLW